MDETPSLDDLALFLTVARAGSLSVAARETDTPLPTLSRRMARLERAIGRTLFTRGPSGYSLTAEGHSLSRRVADLAEVQQAARQWVQQGQGPLPVRITAGFWTSRHLAQTMTPDHSALWRPAFVPSNADLDLARRAADIGIRNRPPDSTRLARQRLRRIDYAIYAISDGVADYVGLPDTVASTPSQRWLRATHGDRITTTASDPRLCLDLALAGFGRIVLPTFAGDAEDGLQRQSDAIPELSHDEWLVSHSNARHDPPIRAALDAIQAVFARR
ncbi:LysR family transcriptional regulator [Sagittula sp. SSi028]|uniref:LysR family transcriptional regulator n=1 Tax=Sagittula sp. SSi028 TaxID=3400636 RepID=UPI003AF5EF5E